VGGAAAAAAAAQRQAVEAAESSSALMFSVEFTIKRDACDYDGNECGDGEHPIKMVETQQ
jgi:hypothetical protein